jgi:hypothetical protein
MFVSKLNEEVYPGVDKLELERALSQIRPQLVVGGARYTMVIPQELAATLNDFGDKNSHNLFLRAVAGIQGKWKQYILINPRRWFRYNFNNMTGDLDAIIAGKPSSLKKVGQAWSELRTRYQKGGALTDAYKEALDRGVFQAGITRQEVPDINQFKGLAASGAQKADAPSDRLAVQSVANLWGALKDSTQFRETLFRYAAYLSTARKSTPARIRRRLATVARTRRWSMLCPTLPTGPRCSLVSWSATMAISRSSVRGCGATSCRSGRGRK